MSQPTSSQGPKNERPPHYSKDSLIDYFKTHSRETVSYILLIAGILLIVPWPFYGGILVGIVAGIYFSNEIINYIKNWKGSLSSSGSYSQASRQIVLLGVAIAFLISAPAIFLGAAISIGIKQLFVN